MLKSLSLLLCLLEIWRLRNAFIVIITYMTYKFINLFHKTLVFGAAVVKPFITFITTDHVIENVWQMTLLTGDIDNDFLNFI